MTNDENLIDAKRNPHDEFYTRIEDIEKEMEHYKEHFEGKVVYCNCDNPHKSKFVEYFLREFDRLKLRRLIATCYVNKQMMFDDEGLSEIGDAYWLDVGEEGKKCGVLKGNGDFRSKECRGFLKDADILVTNPPFSLFREYMKLMMKEGKKFLILGNMNAITYKEVFPLIKENRVWLGCKSTNKDMYFDVPKDFAKELVRTKKEGSAYVIIDGDIKGRLASTVWFTNLEHDKHHQPYSLSSKYSAERYQKYDNYDAIEVDRVEDIPMDYDGIMGVPISFLDKYCPEQFEIVGTIGASGKYNVGKAILDGEDVFKRLLIKRRKMINTKMNYDGWRLII